MEKHSLSVVVPGFLLDVFGTTHAFCQNLQILELPPHLQLIPHSLYDFSLARLFLSFDYSFVFESGDVEVVGQGDSVRFGGIEGYFVVFVGDLVDFCDSGGMRVSEGVMRVKVVVAHHPAGRMLSDVLSVVDPSHAIVYNIRL